MRGGQRDHAAEDPQQDRPHGDPIGARTETLDGRARRAPALDFDQAHRRYRAAGDLDGAAVARVNAIDTGLHRSFGGGVTTLGGFTQMLDISPPRAGLGLLGHEGQVPLSRAYGVSCRARAERVALRRWVRRFAPITVGPPLPA